MLSASCANEESAGPEGSMNQTQAKEQIEAYVTDATNELPTGVELSPMEDPVFLPCEGEPGDENHKVQASHAFWVDGAPEGKNEEIADSLHTFWEAGKWEVTRDGRPEKILIEAKSREYQFRMKSVVSQDGDPSLSGYSPCVQADRTR